jgi:hypothetical protein
MSLKLNVDTDPPVVTKSYEVGGQHTIIIGQEDIGLQDFCALAEYVLTNTDIIPNDPRLPLIEKIKGMKLVDGYTQGRQRLN